MIVSYLLRRLSSYLALRLCLLVHQMQTAAAMKIGIPRLTHTAMMMAFVPGPLGACSACGVAGPGGCGLLVLLFEGLVEGVAAGRYIRGGVGGLWTYFVVCRRRSGRRGDGEEGGLDCF